MTDVETMTTRSHTRDQYADESRMARRRSVWQPTADGRDPSREALDAVVGELARLDRPGRVVEVGCGLATFAAGVAEAAPGTTYLATDQSERMVVPPFDGPRTYLGQTTVFTAR